MCVVLNYYQSNQVYVSRFEIRDFLPLKPIRLPSVLNSVYT